MMSKLFFTIGTFATFAIAASGQTKKTDHSKQAIICLTYDDGLQSHLTTVLPQLDSLGLKGTFFLNSIQGSSEVIGEPSPAVTAWANAALHGHELGNHTLFHACPIKFGWAKKFAIESYTVNKIITEINTQNTILSLLDPSRKRRAFAIPCNNFLVNDTDYTAIIKKQGLVSYARAGGTRDSIITNFKNINVMKVPCWMVEENTSVDELIAFAEKVKKASGMGVYQIHGVGAEFFRISEKTHKAFLNYLKAHQDEYWVATFSEAMDYITSR